VGPQRGASSYLKVFQVLGDHAVLPKPESLHGGLTLVAMQAELCVDDVVYVSILEPSGAPSRQSTVGLAVA
jgi:hypothetical protein